LEAVNEYREALKRREATAANVQKIVQVVHAAADALDDWRQMVIANLQEAHFPAALMQNKETPKINAREWPSIQGIYDALHKYHQADARVQATWQAVPADHKPGLPSPDEESAQPA
jgi:hypothetical protein